MLLQNALRLKEPCSMHIHNMDAIQLSDCLSFTQVLLAIIKLSFDIQNEPQDCVKCRSTVSIYKRSSKASICLSVGYCCLLSEAPQFVACSLINCLHKNYFLYFQLCQVLTTINCVNAVTKLLVLKVWPENRFGISKYFRGVCGETCHLGAVMFWAQKTCISYYSCFYFGVFFKRMYHLP